MAEEQDFYREKERIIRIFNEAKQNTINLIETSTKNLAGFDINFMRPRWISLLKETRVDVRERTTRRLASTFTGKKPYPEVIFYGNALYKTDSDIYEISLHELAHVMLPYLGHSDAWKALYTAIGAKRPPSRTFIPSGKNYMYRYPIGISSRTGAIRYKIVLMSQKYKDAHPNEDKYIIGEKEFT